MPLGDSITHGVEFFDGVNDFPPVNERVGYRLSLFNALTIAGISFDFVGQGGQRAGEDAGLPDPDNNGYPGVDIAFVDNALDTVLDENRPDVILMMIGTNLTPPTADGIDPIIAKVDTWSQDNSPVSLFVATLVPKRDPVLQQVVESFNTDLRQRIQQVAGDNVTLVEQALAVTEADISSEAIGIHPSPSGYQNMSETWFAAMQETGVLASCTQ